MQDIECFEHGATHPIVYVVSQPRVRVRDVSWRTNIEKGGVVNADFNVIMHNETLGDKTSRLYYELYVNDTTRLTGGSLDVALGMYGVDTMRFGAPVPDSVLWSAESPTRISMRLKNRIGGRDVEFYEFDLALREMRYDNGVYYINNVKQDFAWHEVSPRVSVEELNGLYTSRYSLYSGLCAR